MTGCQLGPQGEFRRWDIADIVKMIGSGTTNRMLRISFLVLFAASLALPAESAPLPRAGTFFYSSLCWEPESGDASGYRIKLIRTSKEDRLYLEWSEGPLYGPMLATHLKIEPHAGKISFTIPANASPSDMPTAGSYNGTITAERVILGDDVVPRQIIASKIRVCRKQP